ncbi:MAG: PQQ-binding-like beta-propeller repeat protein, partial [Streptomycetaceae bacterium]|nr:PQQ-binding-like beta-propeller repeat protein [Streptomycetaceae bacterium]
FGALGAAVAGIAARIADLPGGDTKPTGGEVGTDSGARTGALLPTVSRPGAIGGPTRQPRWSQTVDDSVQIITAADGALLVAGSRLASLDAATGTPRWSTPKDKLRRNDIWSGYLPVDGGTVYEQSSGVGDLVALSAKDGTQTWSAPPPSGWYPGGLVGASADLVVLWASTTGGATTDRPGLWAADPKREAPTWSAALDAFEGVPYYNRAAKLVVVSRPKSAQLAAYRADDGGQAAWTATDPADTGGTGQGSAFATAVSGYGTTTYWATNRLYALDENGKHIWPVGLTDSGDNGAFHAVAADADTVYAAVSVTFGADVIVAYKASDGAPKWRAAWPKEFHNPSLECELALGAGNLYIVDRYSQTLVALDAATGDTVWQYHDPNPGKGDGSDDWRVAADDSHVYIAYGTTVRAFTAK